MEHQPSKSIIDDSDEESLFVDASNSFESDHSLCISGPSSTITNNNLTTSIQSKHSPESPSSSSSADRELVSGRSFKQASPSHSCRDNPDGSVDFHPYRSTAFPANESEVSCSEKSKTKLNSTRIRVSSSIARKLKNKETNRRSSIPIVNDDSIAANSPNSGSNFASAIARLLIKLIGFQINLFFSFITFPIWLIYSSYMFMINPFRIITRAKHYTLGNISRIWGFSYGRVKWFIYIGIKKYESTWKFFLRIGWGLLCSAYVGFVLISLLVFAFVISGVILKCIMEEPVEIEEQLNFDYTKESPMAFVPIMSCPEPSFLECKEQLRPESRVIPLHHKVRATISLTLPESYYNRNLGVFQIRVDFLSGSGKPLASTRQPCMLRFKSQPIRLILTIFKLAPLITGYSTESQTLNIKFKGYTEKNIPTSCLRVIMEQRAEFKRGGGVPEIYAASLKLESQPPFLKRVLWYWKGTVFVWFGIIMFLIELFFALSCCTSVVPWLRPRRVLRNDNYVSRNNRGGSGSGSGSGSSSK